MKRTLTIGAATAVLLLAGAGVALAQNDDGPRNCGDAVVALTNAQNAHTAAQAADKALADAQAADKAAEGARAAALAHPDWPGATTEPNAAERARILAAPAGNAALEQSRRERVALIDAAITAKGQADKVDVEDAGTEAEKTDADKTGKAVEQARADFDRLCQPGDETAPPSASPAPPVETPAPAAPSAPGYSQVQAVPVGGVSTGA